MQDQTVGEALGQLARHKAQVVVLTIVAVIGLVLLAAREGPAPGAPATQAAASSTEVTPRGSATESGALGEPAGTAAVEGLAGVVPARPAGRPVSAGGGGNESPGGVGGPSTPPAPSPLTLVTDQLPTILAAAGPAITVLEMLSPLYPPLSVPPIVAVPALPAELAPVLAALAPAIGPVCGNLGLAVIVAVVAGGLPLPVTGQHISATLGNVYAVCGALTPVAQG